MSHHQHHHNHRNHHQSENTLNADTVIKPPWALKNDRLLSVQSNNLTVQSKAGCFCCVEFLAKETPAVIPALRPVWRNA